MPSNYTLELYVLEHYNSMQSRTIKYERICPLVSRILEKRTRTNIICHIFHKQIFVLYEIVFKHEYV